MRHEAEIDDVIESWTRQHDFDTILASLEAAGVPAGPIYSVADQMQDPHFQARGNFEQVPIGGDETVTLPTFAPKFSATPGGTEWAGPPLGAHNQEVYGELLGLTDAELEALRAQRVI